METKDISKAVIARLPRYYRYLGELLNEGTERISSGELSVKMNVTASQIRQDLNKFGGFGQQGYGYNVRYLRDEIGKILGLDEQHPMVIIGAGNLGQAIANAYKSIDRGFRLTGIFDKNPDLEGKQVAGMGVRMMEELPAFIKKENIRIAALMLPEESSQEVADLVTQNGVKAIWNFSHRDLSVSPDVTVENVHLSDSLMTLLYSLSGYRKGESSES